MITAGLFIGAISALFLLPGYALVQTLRVWREESLLSRLLLSAGVGAAIYPIVFYALRGVVVIGRTHLLILFAISTLIIFQHHLRFGVGKVGKFDRLTLLFLIVLTLTFLSRYQFALRIPFPAWSDSLHHTLLTQLTAESGQLPDSLEPFFPNLLNMYHLGLYAISGSVAMLTKQPAHLSLLWTAQTLNGMATFGVYLILQRFSGRTAAIVGAAIVGLFSVHPALWSSWGRYTQLTSVVLLPIAWLLVVDAVMVWRNRPKEQPRWGILILAALLCAAVFLTHFRVGVFFALLLLPTVAGLSWQSRKNLLSVLIPIGTIGIVSVLFISPALLSAFEVYLAGSKETAEALQTVDPERNAAYRASYYDFPFAVYPYLVAPTWLLWTTAAAVVIGLIQRSKLTLLMLAWSFVLFLLGNAYLLRMPVLNVTNLGAILIMYYLPIALIVGVAIGTLLNWIPESRRAVIQFALLAIVLAAAGPAAYIRTTRTELYRHFIRGTDRIAMDWINVNTPPDSLFAINTYYWLPNFAHGTDAGYFIPYFTGRDITLSSMLSEESPAEYTAQISEWAALTESLETSHDALDDLYEAGVDYIYIGEVGDFAGEGLQVDFLLQSADVELAFQLGQTAILKINPPSASR